MKPVQQLDEERAIEDQLRPPWGTVDGVQTFRQTEQTRGPRFWQIVRRRGYIHGLRLRITPDFDVGYAALL